MDRERWEQIEKLFHAAWQVPAERREIFLAGRCGGDDDMRRAVEALLNQASSGAFDAAIARQRHRQPARTPRRRCFCLVRPWDPIGSRGRWERGEWEKSTGQKHRL